METCIDNIDNNSTSTRIILEYIWIDSLGNTRSKTMVRELPAKVWRIDEVYEMLDDWNYDGSSTGQASGNDSEVLIRPVKVCKDPFSTSSNSYLVLCDTWLPDGSPHPTNTREIAKKIFSKHGHSKPIYGMEQEFFLSVSGIPIAWKTISCGCVHPTSTSLKNPKKPQGDYYCGGGGDNSFGRECIRKAFDRCLSSGLHLTGMNAEVAPSQWEFQICTEGINAGDEMHLMRYIINRTAEEYGWTLDLNPKPVDGDWNGSGCHTNFSTEVMRSDGGYKHILDAIQKLEKKHDFHMKHYGEGNRKRMTGLHETASFDKFSYGVADRGASIRIPRKTEAAGKGYLEDRRPASNMDPYTVSSLILETVMEDIS